MHRFCCSPLLVCQRDCREVVWTQCLKQLLLFLLQTNERIILLLLILADLLYDHRRCCRLHICRHLHRIGLYGCCAKLHQSMLRFIHFQRNIQRFPRLQPCNQSTQPVDFCPPVGNILIGLDSLIHIQLRFRFNGIHQLRKIASVQLYS